MWSTLLLIGVSLFFIYRFIKSWVLDPWRIHKDLWKQGIPGTYTPVIGEIFRIRRALLADDPLSYVTEMAAKFGDYYHVSFGPVVQLSISDSSLIQGVLKTNVRAYHKSTLAKLILGAWTRSNNLLLSEDGIHSRHRRMIEPVFDHKNMKSMISLIAKTTSHILSKWTAAVACEQGNMLTLNIHEEMARLTLDIVAGCVFGSEVMRNEQVHEIMYQSVRVTLNEVEKRTFNMLGIIPIINQLPLPSKRRIEKSSRDVRLVIQRIIDERKRGLTKSACKGFLSLSLSFFVSLFPSRSRLA
jgi:cytochrome P450